MKKDFVQTPHQHPALASPIQDLQDATRLLSALLHPAPQVPLTTAAALPIHCSTGKVSIVVSLHDPSYFSLGLIRRLICYRAAKLSTRFPQKTGLLRRFHTSLPDTFITHFDIDI